MNLEQIRAELDKVDTEIVQLFEQRMQLSAQVATVKRQHNLPITNQAREQEILTRIGQEVTPELKDYTQMLFTTLFNLSKSYQKSLPGHKDE